MTAICIRRDVSIEQGFLGSHGRQRACAVLTCHGSQGYSQLVCPVQQRDRQAVYLRVQRGTVQFRRGNSMPRAVRIEDGDRNPGATQGNGC